MEVFVALRSAAMDVPAAAALVVAVAALVISPT
jgi:hypothetical protein